VGIELFRIEGGKRDLVVSATTNRDGRTAEPLLEGESLPRGNFELVFHAGNYFRALGVALADPPFLDEVAIRFSIDPAGGSYHVPLLVAPYGYSTYRGS
jgi:5-hydroxyisourate hydrolase